MTITTLKAAREELAKHNVTVTRRNGIFYVSYAGSELRTNTQDPQLLVDLGMEHRKQIIAQKEQRAQQQRQQREEQEAQKSLNEAQRAEEADAAWKKLVADAKAIIAQMEINTDSYKAASFFTAAMNKITAYHKERIRFSQQLISSPVYALDWSHNLFTMAAEAEVATRILASLLRCTELGKTPAEMRDAIIEQQRSNVLRMASSTSCSTSPTSNLISRAQLAAAASVCDAFYS